MNDAFEFQADVGRYRVVHLPADALHTERWVLESQGSDAMDALVWLEICGKLPASLAARLLWFAVAQLAKEAEAAVRKANS